MCIAPVVPFSYLYACVVMFARCESNNNIAEFSCVINKQILTALSDKVHIINVLFVQFSKSILINLTDCLQKMVHLMLNIYLKFKCHIHCDYNAIY